MSTVLSAAARNRLPLVGLFILLLAGCATGPKLVTPKPPPIPSGGPPVPEQNEAVLSDGTQLIADAPWGRIKIEAGPGLRRVYTWRDYRRGVVLEPRKEKFAGSMGIHYEGKPPTWEPADGITKVNVEEGQRHFETMDDAMIWMQIRRLRYSWNNSGLVVGWKPDGDTLKVELWQFYIDGKQPTSMPDADDSRITTGQLQVVPQKMDPVLVFADGHREPYTAKTASRYSVARPGGAASTSKTASSQTTPCNWFQRLFSQCTVASAATAESAAQASTQADSERNAAAKTAAPSEAASQGTPPAKSPESSDKAADSTATQNAPPAPDTSAPRAEIASDLVNVRNRPTTDSDVLSQAKQGDSVRVLKKDRGWRYVELGDGRKGWVADFLLKHKE